MKTAVAGIVTCNNKILIGKKIILSNHFLSGGWHIPGGHVRKNEDLVTAIIREYKEETDLDISIIRKLAEKIIPENGVVVHWYLCKSTSTVAKPREDLSEIKFVDKIEVIKQCDIRAKKLWPKEVLEYFMEK